MNKKDDLIRRIIKKYKANNISLEEILTELYDQSYSHGFSAAKSLIISYSKNYSRRKRKHGNYSLV